VDAPIDGLERRLARAASLTPPSTGANGDFLASVSTYHFIAPIYSPWYD
jgi:hypothetical protein